MKTLDRETVAEQYFLGNGNVYESRVVGNSFGDEKYAREELVVELGALFAESDLGLNLKAEHYEDHSDYLKSWISVLKNDYSVFFSAVADAEKAADRIVGRYRLRDKKAPVMTNDQKCEQSISGHRICK